jgi:hypothetical protein
MFLYMLKLLDDKTLKKVHDALYPARRMRARKRKARQSKSRSPAITKARKVAPTRARPSKKVAKRRTKGR